MRFDPAQLETLTVILEEGSFEGAARRLHLTPSAVSQRVRALERAAGQVLVRRTSPVTVVPAGEPLVRLGRQLRLLAAEAAVALGGDPGAEEVLELSVAVNADSLATWFRPVLAAGAGRAATALRLHVEDESFSHDLLRRGEVLAAVTSEPRPVQGCSVEPLGLLRYRAASAPWLLERHRRGRGVDWGGMPLVVFNERDRLQDQVLEGRGSARPAVVHRVPSTADFLEAIRCGLGWGMLPEPQLAPAVAAGELVRLPGPAPVDVGLHWQRWRLESAALDALTGDVRRAATSLRRPHGVALAPGT
ncbi:ArgP/LysG family DNA-binding transcriptional regulator [Nocardioides sp. dk4132]|uniref:ArgP/LysG family DNA-binding transcriptional regulator n=1 Tax=unclassified Nocardioides TaxID=2615069 RepID=UPI0012954176|nr:MULTISPECIES: ArgP/LysG family DNA-binding transcriptional regulator [unclassified Nocardioides]MQW76703.1 ArgP/LysG family DNA-binding transcriptional regulator [Nocardioides sp. dk4132]QGA06938.1 ArgP/LysG family DNA-binding transcriptional regulator [Nocardioides sp. dk884]